MSILTSTLRHAAPNVCSFLIGLMPFVIGFVILTQLVFWKFYRFKNVLRTFITLFGLLNGDAMWDIFKGIKESG